MNSAQQAFKTDSRNPSILPTTHFHNSSNGDNPFYIFIMSTKLKPAAARDMPFLKYTVAVESWRVTAYIFFWTMCIFAICMANLFVVPAMKAGPAVPGSPCGPFNRVSY
jgi:hypothetical protein